MPEKLSHWLCRILLAMTSPWLVGRVWNLVLLLSFRAGHQKPPDLKKLKNVLVIHFGDARHALMITGMLRELRRNMPEANIVLIVRRGVTNVVETCPYLDEIVTYECDGPPSGWNLLRLRRRAFRLAVRHLWKRRFDLALIPRWGSDAGQEKYVALFCGARYRAGYSTYATGTTEANAGYDRLLTHVVPRVKQKHEVEQHYDFIRLLGGEVKEDKLEIWLTERDKMVAADTLKSCGFDENSHLIALGIDARHPKGLWPIERFAQLGKWLIEELGAKIVILGNREDKDWGVILQEKLGKNAVDLTGQMSWRQSAAILKQSSLYIGCGAVSTQIAAVCNVEMIMISHHPISGSPESLEAPTLLGPWQASGIIVSPPAARPPCTTECTGIDAHCILAVPLETVQQYVLPYFSLLAQETEEKPALAAGKTPLAA